MIDNLDWPAATGVDDARPEYFQLALWSDDSTFRIEDKSRQIAWSWSIAADAVASAVLEKRSSVFVSINLSESQEKIRYVNSVYDHLRIGGLPNKERDTLSEVEFDNGVRITSLPSKPARGRARANVYLDEFAHAPRDQEIYTGTLPVISKGGRLRIGSSPLGASGLFWEIYEEKLRRWPGYIRRRTPWWEIYAFCVNVREARKEAPALPTAERVERFGNERIQTIFSNMPLEDFQQEFETLFVDETSAWISWDEIKTAQDSEMRCLFATCRGTDVTAAFDAIDTLGLLVASAVVEVVYAAGVDVGRTRNTTELYLVGLSTLRSYPLRLAVTMDAMPFDEQFSIIAHALDRLPVVKMLIDRNGIGRNLAENLQDAFGGKAIGVDFTNETKRLWATDAKMLIQKGKTPLPVDRDIAYQIHSIKRLVTANRNLIFDTERNEKHHADKFWAWALALSAGHDGLHLVGANQLLEHAFAWN